MPARRSWTALLAALLLLVPLALRAHVHVGHPSADCAVCVVSHHMPAVRESKPAVVAPAVVASAVADPLLAEPVQVARPVHTGRGPPSLLSSPSS
jgi:hypothetical protein